MIAFFVSSTGDTHLAKATISNILKRDAAINILLIPVTQTAARIISDLAGTERIVHSTLADILNRETALSEKQISQEDLEKIANLMSQFSIDRAFIGMPSPNDEEIPFQIANYLSTLDIAVTIANEFMFSPPQEHPLHKYLDRGELSGCRFAVSLQAAAGGPQLSGRCENK